MPTSCEGQLDFVAIADSWQGSAELPPRTSSTPPLTGCEKLEFAPSASALLSSPRASSPTGYAFDIKVDARGVTDPLLHRNVLRDRLRPTPVRKAVVTLPEGVSINPSVGAGLGVCSKAQYETAETASSPFGAGCPSESKIGDFSVSSPIVAGPIEGGDLPRRAATTTPSAACSPSTWSPSRSSGASWSRSPASSNRPRSPAASPRPSTNCRSCPTRTSASTFAKASAARWPPRRPAARSRPRPTSRRGATPAWSSTNRCPPRSRPASGGGPCPSAWRPSRRRRKAARSTPAPAPTRPSTCTSPAR